jgi:hypothetical protein
MRYLVLFLLMTSTVLAVDTTRVGTHTVDENLTDTLNYVDYFYGEYANSTETMIKSYPNELDYIKDRSGSLVVSRWSIMYSNESVMLNVTGVYPGFVAKEGKQYKIDYMGFIDDLCTGYPYSLISKIDQEFDFQIILPEKLKVISTQKNGSEDLDSLFYNLTVEVRGNIVYKHVRLTVKKDTNVFSYCSERERLNTLLKHGIIAEEGSGPDVSGFPWVIAILVLLCLSLAYLVRK